MRFHIAVPLVLCLVHLSVNGFANGRSSESRTGSRSYLLVDDLPSYSNIATVGSEKNTGSLSLGWKSKTLNRHRRKRYILQGSRWKVNPITYTISKYPAITVLEKEVIDKEIEAAFRMWEDVSSLRFKREFEDKVNIDIRFERGSHGDDEVFDGRGGTTAHAYYPNYGGGIHFDADELWTSQSPIGINLFQVTHLVRQMNTTDMLSDSLDGSRIYHLAANSAILHFAFQISLESHQYSIYIYLLGLEHSDSMEKTVMRPYYENYDANFKLQNDDIKGIQKLYGKKFYTICDNSNIDAGVKMVDGAIYIFRGNLVHKMETFGGPVDPGYPKDISAVFQDLHGPLDAAITRSNGITYFFKGEDFWRFTNMTMDFDFPKKISQFFPNIPTPLDAAVVLPRDENIYFMKGSHYWKFDHTKEPPVSTNYPRSIAEWKGIPISVDAAVRAEENGEPTVYFFKEDKYWKFNDRSESVYVTNPPYPRRTRDLFTRCVVK